MAKPLTASKADARRFRTYELRGVGATPAAVTRYIRLGWLACRVEPWRGYRLLRWRVTPAGRAVLDAGADVSKGTPA